MKVFSIISLLMLISPLLMMVIVRIKAIFAGRVGPSWFFYYHTLIKLLKKDLVISTSCSAVFIVAPAVYLAVLLMIFFFMPVAGYPAIFKFSGDVLLIIYLLAFSRFLLLLAAWDTASSFEAMGAAREAFFSMLAEVVFFVIVIILYRLTNDLCLSSFMIEGKKILFAKATYFPIVLLVISLFMILLIENGRVPVDDPATHLELTMIHEVIILDYSGPLLAAIHFASYLKLLFYSLLLTNFLWPMDLPFAATTTGLTISWLLILNILEVVVFILILVAIYTAIGILESLMARMAMKRVPSFALSSLVLAVVAAILSWRST